MEKVRANLKRRQTGAPPASAPGHWRPDDGPTGGNGTRPAPEAVLHSGIPLSDLAPLRIEIDGALAGHRLVGQVNPRGPGLHNQIFQFVKKVMRRSLTWYTRPLHIFQGAVIRALQQVAAILNSHSEALQQLGQSMTAVGGRSEQHALEAAKQQASLASAINTLNRSTAALTDKFSALESRTTALESNPALGARVDALENHAATILERISILDGVTASLPAMLAEVGDITRRFDEKLDQARSSVLAIQTATLNRAQAAFTESVAAITNEIGRMQGEANQLRGNMREAELQSKARERDLRRLIYDSQPGSDTEANAPSAPPTPPMFPSAVTEDAAFDYYLFEERYRGEESLIYARQTEYLELFRGRDNVVDIGCGRGEFLQLLRDNGIRASGVELGTDQYLLCRSKGLNVVQQDLFSYLESVPDGSLGGLFSAQVIEHLSASDQLRFVALSHRKTRPGSPVVFETINAQCVFAVMRNFFVDPTHVRPVHPETLKFAMESVSFKSVELRFSSPMTERQIPPLHLNGDTPQLAEFNRAIAQLNDLVYGYMDYAAIGWR